MSKPSWLEEDRLKRIEALLERIAVALETPSRSKNHKPRPENCWGCDNHEEGCELAPPCGVCGGLNGRHSEVCTRG